jgi:hypothetical protein
MMIPGPSVPAGKQNALDSRVLAALSERSISDSVALSPQQRRHQLRRRLLLSQEKQATALPQAM